MSDLKEALDRARGGGPQRHHDKSMEQGKLPVRERVARLVDADTSRGTAVIYGRSDSTINRGGVRMGTSEIYSAVEGVDEVLDSLVVDVDERMLLFVVLREGATLDDSLAGLLRGRLREHCSPRHVPDAIHAIAEVPRTLSNKKLEVPVKKILLGADPARAASRDSLANPAALDWFVERADELRVSPQPR